MYVRSALESRTIPESNINMTADLESGSSNSPGGVGVNSDWNSVWSGLRFGKSKSNSRSKSVQKKNSKFKNIKSNSKSKSKFKNIKASYSLKNYISRKKRKSVRKVRKLKSKSRTA